MELTNKVHYLVTEYNANLKPQMLTVTQYIYLINSLANAPIDMHFNNLSDADRMLLEAEVLADRTKMLKPLIDKVKILGNKMVGKATDLIVSREDHVVDMSSNVDMDTDLAELIAETEALKTTITGMNGIIPGGGAGAAIVVAENVPKLAALAELVTDKNTQIAEATQEIPILIAAGVELTNFIEAIATLPDL